MVHALVLLGVGFGAPLAVVVLGHVEQPERDDLVLVADVPGVVGALEAGRLPLAGIPGVAELLPGPRLQATGGEHDNHAMASCGGVSVGGTQPRPPGAGKTTAARRTAGRRIACDLAGR